MDEQEGVDGRGVVENKPDVDVISGLSKRKRIDYWMISTLVLLVVLVTGVGVWFVGLKKGGLTSRPTEEQGGGFTVTGVIRRSGLSWEEKQKLGLTSIEYQITDFGDYQKAVEEGRVMGYFLQSNEKLGDLQGKCVRVSGVIPDEWKNRNKDDAYGRLVLNVAGIEKVEMTGCKPYLQEPPVVSDDVREEMAFRGIVIHDSQGRRRISVMTIGCCWITRLWMRRALPGRRRRRTV